jgi:hypothetical protein
MVASQHAFWELEGPRKAWADGNLDRRPVSIVTSVGQNIGILHRLDHISYPFVVPTLKLQCFRCGVGGILCIACPVKSRTRCLPASKQGAERPTHGLYAS